MFRNRRRAEGRLVGTSQFREPSFGSPTGDSLPIRSQSLFDGPHEVVERFFHQTWDSTDPDEFGPTVDETWHYYHDAGLDNLSGATRYAGNGRQEELFFIRDHLGSVVLTLKAEGEWAAVGMNPPMFLVSATAIEAVDYTPYGVPTVHSRSSIGEAFLRVHNESISHSQADGGSYITDSVREGEAYGNWVWAAESPRGATDQDGRVPKSAAQSSVGLKYLYASRPWSPVAEAYHNRARWYSPEAGRFLSRDPIGYLGGVNQYMYAAGNPVGFRDPWGLKEEPEGGPPIEFPSTIPPGARSEEWELRSSLFKMDTIGGLLNYFLATPKEALGMPTDIRYHAQNFQDSDQIGIFRDRIQEHTRTHLWKNNNWGSLHQTGNTYRQWVDNIDNVWVMGRGQMQAETTYLPHHSDPNKIVVRTRFWINDTFQYPAGVKVDHPAATPYRQWAEWYEYEYYTSPWRQE